MCYLLWNPDNVSKYTKDFLTCKTGGYCYQPSYSDIAKLISYKSEDIEIEFDVNSIIIKKNTSYWKTGQVIIPLSKGKPQNSRCAFKQSS